MEIYIPMTRILFSCSTPINFGQQLVDDSVMNSGATSHAPSLLADGINFIKDDDVQTTVSTKLLREEIMLKVTI